MKVSKDFVVRKIAGEYVIVPTGRSALHFNALAATNDVGGLLFERLQQGATEAELVSAVMQEYEIDETSCRRDVAEFLEMLRAQGLLEE